MNRRRIMQSKHYFQQFKDEIKEEHQKFDTHQDAAEINNDHCNHKGKVKMDKGMLKCICGAGWSGPNLDLLLKHLNCVV